MTVSILFIGDDPVLRTHVASLLHRPGYSVAVSTNRHEAGALIARVSMELVILDVPKLDQETIQTILDLRRQHPRLPLLALTGAGRVDSIAKALGASSLLRKPFRDDDLLAKVEALLKASPSK